MKMGMMTHPLNNLSSSGCWWAMLDSGRLLPIVPHPINQLPLYP